ncbi:MAG: hypothetical protein A2W01_00525 [Candidatus Solincola sediminis]|uniref:Uncharacterized protein n=1 Tax=Candidatus Solincola sediminis TaxID=1797199 RepID=A0A1F2WJ97_9ACTN|nr:MAG: hypothetical protein A2Y75_07005 [Candidatus Solincola sediminis]OFW60339.1 MAG: hypothetical protein A2W01_00525 [Candidatus Solincola sediminis]
MYKNKRLLPLYAAAAIALLLLAGCGWTSGSTFQGEYNPATADPVTVVQNWLESMQFRESTNDEGQVQRIAESGRDFNLWLSVIDPAYLTDPTTGRSAATEDIQQLDAQWQATDWEVEFRDIQLREISKTDTEATVEIFSGAVRYIGKQFFETAEYKQDSFGDKKAEVYLKRYESGPNDPLNNVPGLEGRAVSRWVITGGLDLGESETFGETP